MRRKKVGVKKKKLMIDRVRRNKKQGMPDVWYKFSTEIEIVAIENIAVLC